CVAFHGRPRFRFSPKGTSFVIEGGLQCFNLIAIPITCLQMYSFKQFGQLQNPFFHSDPMFGKVTFQIPN
ncbi:unnamed protein product, partial [Rotaria magnacalcarata]